MLVLGRVLRCGPAMTEIGVPPEPVSPATPASQRQRAAHAGKLHIRVSDWIASVKRVMKRKKLLPKMRLRKKAKKVNMR